MALLMEQQERQLREIVTQTISVLCRNSLPFTSELSLRGLLAVTLDRSRVVLLDISDTTSQRAQPISNGPDDVIVVEPEPGELIGGQKRAWRDSPRSKQSISGQLQKDLSALALPHDLLGGRGGFPVNQSAMMPSTAAEVFASTPRAGQEMRACSADSYLPKPHPSKSESSDDYRVQCRVAELLENAKAQMQEMGPLCALMQPGAPQPGQMGETVAENGCGRVKEEPATDQPASDAGGGDRNSDQQAILGEMALVIKEEVSDDCMMEPPDDTVRPVQLIENPSTVDWRDKIQEIVDSMHTPPGTEEEYEELMERTVEQVISSCEIYSSDGKVHCPICNERLRSLYHLRRHLRTHVRTSLPYPSGSYLLGASSEAVTSTTSKVGSPTDTSDKSAVSMKCPVCGLTCKCRFDLQKHMYIHTGEKPHTCVLCGKGFRQSSSLNVHMKQHFHGDKPYKCATCGKGFRQSSHLNVHRLVHTGERPHVCRVCQRGFSASSNLRKHMLSHTGERPFRCSHCGMAFTYLPTLKSHVLKQCGKLRRKRQTRFQGAPEQQQQEEVEHVAQEDTNVEPTSEDSQATLEGQNDD